MWLQAKHHTWYFINFTFFNSLENSTKKKLLPNCKVRKESQSLNNLSKAKTKTKTNQTAFIFFLPHWAASYYHSHTLDLGTKRLGACTSIMLL